MRAVDDFANTGASATTRPAPELHRHHGAVIPTTGSPQGRDTACACANNLTLEAVSMHHNAGPRR